MLPPASPPSTTKPPRHVASTELDSEVHKTEGSERKGALPPAECEGADHNLLLANDVIQRKGESTYLPWSTASWNAASADEAPREATAALTPRPRSAHLGSPRVGRPLHVSHASAAVACPCVVTEVARAPREPAASLRNADDTVALMQAHPKRRGAIGGSDVAGAASNLWAEGGLDSRSNEHQWPRSGKVGCDARPNQGVAVCKHASPENALGRRSSLGQVSERTWADACGASYAGRRPARHEYSSGADATSSSNMPPHASSATQMSFHSGRWPEKCAHDVTSPALANPVGPAAGVTIQRDTVARPSNEDVVKQYGVNGNLPQSRPLGTLYANGDFCFAADTTWSSGCVVQGRPGLSSALQEVSRDKMMLGSPLMSDTSEGFSSGDGAFTTSGDGSWALFNGEAAGSSDDAFSFALQDLGNGGW